MARCYLFLLSRYATGKDGKLPNVINYLDEEIFSDNIVDLNHLDLRLANLSLFRSALYKKKMTLEYIEIAPKVLIVVQEMERAYGITEHDIKILQEWILGCKDKYFNAHSVWHKLRDDGLAEKLQNNEWMCTCIFRQQETVFSLQVAGGIIFIEFKDKFLEENAAFTGYDASEGALYVLFMLSLAMHPDAPEMFAIDSFDHALNPKLAKKVTEIFSQLVIGMGRTVFMTTHNPLVLDGLDLSNDNIKLFTVERSRYGYA